jgi:hypothetical protein
MTDQELKDLVASLAVQSQKAEREMGEIRQLFKETEAQLKETDVKETDVQLKKTDVKLKELAESSSKQFKELGKQIGGLGNKFGSFTEGLALPSVERLLYTKFKADIFLKNIRKRMGEDAFEVDGFGYSNGKRNKGFVVEVKSHLDKRAIEQMQKTMHNFRKYFPQFADKILYGVLAAAEARKDNLEAAYKAGFYVVMFHDELMRFKMPSDFEPKKF